MKSRIKAFAIAGTLVTIGMAVGSEAVLAYQSHMFAARNDLRAAAYQLSIAEHDKAGHRDNAANLVSQALQQVNEGISAGR